MELKMKSWIKLIVGAQVLLMTGCAGELPYPAPIGTELVIHPEEIKVSVNLQADTDLIAVVDVQVWNPETERFYNNVLVTVKSSYPGVILIPETAILSTNANDDTDWQVAASEYYYQLTNVKDDISPDYLETATDYRGVARVYVYLKCLPMLCGSMSYDSCYVKEQLAEGSDSSDFENCKLSEANLYFYTGVDSDFVKFSPAQ